MKRVFQGASDRVHKITGSYIEYHKLSYAFCRHNRSRFLISNKELKVHPTNK
jgi:hypothetical protein